MTPRVWAVSGLLLAAAATTALADGAKISLNVSAQVVRSCRVTTDPRQVTVDCGTRPQMVKVSYSGRGSVARTVTDRTEIGPASTSSVTLDF